LRVFLGGVFEPGARVFARLAELDRRIRNADLVITGEGQLDAQSLMGKGVGAVAEAAAHAGKPCLCLAGRVELAPSALPGNALRTFECASEGGSPAERLRDLAAMAARAAD
jgi:glycerate kinase